MALLFPWFLLGLLAVSIPIAIHFFELRKPQLVHFTNVGFIREVKLITARQSKLKHLLVLLARIGFVLFLVLMFCQPFIPAAKKGVKQGEFVSMFIDTSPSMQVHGNDQSLLDKAVEEANGLVNVYPATTQFKLPPAANNLNKFAFQVATEQLSVSGQAAGLSALIAKGKGQTRNGNGQTFIFSDFQKNGFSSRSLAQIDSTESIFLVPIIQDEATPNVYIDSVLVDDAFVRRGTDILLRIRLRNGGQVAVDNCQVKLFIGDKQVAVYRASVGTESPTTTSVRVRIDNNELQRCRVEVEDFPVTFDNTYYFTLQPSPQIRIIDLAAGEPATQRLYANESLFSYSKSAPQTISYSKIEGANLALVQQPRVDASLRESIKRLVDKGGSVVIVPPALTAGRASYNQLFKDLGIGSVQWEPVPSGTPSLREVAAPSSQNPFFKDVFAARNRQAVMPKVSPVLRWSRSETDILRLQDGDGYLASFNSGRGTVFLFSAPFEAEYSDFTNHALFVPVMYRLAMESFRNDQNPAYRLNQRTIVVAVPEVTDNTEQVFKLTKDSSTFIPVQRLQAGELRFDVPPGMQIPGFYQLTRNGRTVKTLAFNVDKRESNLAHYSAEELRTLIGKNHPNIQVYDASGGQTVAAQYRAERIGTPLWQYCLWAALACLLAEVLLLRFMTRRKMAEPMAVAA
ncbi:BatA domain-containing protein [Hymenobacter sp. BT188]|uniref:BatA domain-containing protein n=1 Tax=Hymenobacter sp. BT188 TaxID=2763504 RepID=UPI0016514EB5|nr:BatA domain-containing protein [Hymenobacter sp. BT188]MBC6609277.1 BatA domain-containing protein [Hymenobacter sp. BT188]